MTAAKVRKYPHIVNVIVNFLSKAQKEMKIYFELQSLCIIFASEK